MYPCSISHRRCVCVFECGKVCVCVCGGGGRLLSQPSQVMQNVTMVIRVYLVKTHTQIGRASCRERV